MAVATGAQTIVIADDEAAIRTLLTRQLERAGYGVTACANGRDALRAMRELGSGILIADWQMPDVDGLELTRTIREQSAMKALGLVYILLLTANSDKAHIVAGLEAGADDYLTKPYHADELLARIRSGERILALQSELIAGRLEVNKVNAQVTALNARLEKLANTDPLTGLHNRRYVFERAGDALALAERSDARLGFIMLDIDRFKSINDTHGHAAGDRVLVHVARTIRQTARRYDVCGRVGGEEFVIFCPAATIEGTAALAERLRVAVAGQPIPIGDQALAVTVSVGATTRVATDTAADALVSRADALLYKAKQNGRNQVWYTAANGAATPLAPAAELIPAGPG